MSVYPIGKAAPAPARWPRTVSDFASRSCGCPRSEGPIHHLLTFLSGRWRGIAVFCEILSDDGEKIKFFFFWKKKRGKEGLQRSPAECQLMTTAPASWRWWQLVLNDNGMPAVEFARSCYLSWHGSGEGLIFLTFDHANLSPDTLFCIYILRCCCLNRATSSGSSANKGHRMKESWMWMRDETNEAPARTSRRWPSGDERAATPF